MSTLIRRNIRIDGRRTSTKLEMEMWDALEEICRHERTTISNICTDIHRQEEAGNFTSKLRVYILEYYRAGATNGNHIHSGQEVHTRH